MQRSGCVSIKRHNREFWEAAVRDVQAGQDVAAVAKRHGVRPGTLSWWLWNLRRTRPKTGKRRRAETGAAFLPVVVAEPIITSRMIELEVAGTRLRVEPGTDVEYLAALVGALRSC